MVKKLSFLLITVIALASCSLQKRNYMPGYHVQWKNSSSGVEKMAKTPKQSPKNNPTVLPEVKSNFSSEKDFVLKANLLVSAQSSAPKATFTGTKTYLDNCDTLVLRNGTEIKAKVLEITPTQVKYKYCNNLDGPLIIVSKSDVALIKYVNGQRDEFKEEPIVNTNTLTPTDKANEYVVMRDSKASYTLGILSFCGFLAMIPILPLLGIIFAIMAILKGRRAMDRMYGDERLKSLYYEQARKGILFGKIFLYILLAIVLIVLLLFLFLASTGLI